MPVEPRRERYLVAVTPAPAGYPGATAGVVDEQSVLQELEADPAVTVLRTIRSSSSASGAGRSVSFPGVA